MTKWLSAFVLLTVPAVAQTVPVTGTAQYANGQAGSVGVQFALVNCGRNNPTVIGSGVIVTTPPVFPTDANGNIEGPDGVVGDAKLYANDQITCGGSETSRYAVSYLVNGVQTGPTQYYFVGSGTPFNLNTALPVQALPPITQPYPNFTLCQPGTVAVGYNNDFSARCMNLPTTANTGLVVNPAGSQQVLQPTGTTFSANNVNLTGLFNGTFSGAFNGATINTTSLTSTGVTATNLTSTTETSRSNNSVLNPTLFPGSDLGAQINAALTQLGSTCGDLLVPSGSYTWSTPVVMNPCVHLRSWGAFVNVPALTKPFLAIAQVPNQANPNILADGGVEGFTFSGPANALDTSGASWTQAQQNQIGIYLGGDPANSITPSNALDFLTNFRDVHLRGFGCGVSYGNAFQTAYFGGSFEGNWDGVCFQAPNVGLENINFHGTQILNNINDGLYGAPSTDPEIFMEDVSLDYNGQNHAGGAGAVISGGVLSIRGGHIEGPLASVNITTSGAALTVRDTIYNYTDSSGSKFTLPAFFTINGTNGTVYLDNLNVGQYLDPVSELILWNAAGGDNRLYIGNLRTTFQGNLHTLPLYQSGANIQFYDVPVFNAMNGDVIGRSSNAYTAQTFNATGTAASTFQSLYAVNANANSFGVAHLANNAGIQVASAPGCTFAAGAPGSACNTSVQLSYPEPDTNYMATCSVNNATGVTAVGSVTPGSTVAFNVQLDAINNTSTGGGTVECIVMHN